MRKYLLKHLELEPKKSDHPVNWISDSIGKNRSLVFVACILIFTISERKM